MEERGTKACAVAPVPWYCFLGFFFFSYTCALLQRGMLQVLPQGLDCRPTGGHACAHEEGTPHRNVQVNYTSKPFVALNEAKKVLSGVV